MRRLRSDPCFFPLPPAVQAGLEIARCLHITPVSNIQVSRCVSAFRVYGTGSVSTLAVMQYYSLGSWVLAVPRA